MDDPDRDSMISNSFVFLELENSSYSSAFLCVEFCWCFANGTYTERSRSVMRRILMDRTLSSAEAKRQKAEPPKLSLSNLHLCEYQIDSIYF